MVITVSCPACETSFPADPNKIPEAGVKVRCSQCAHVFRVERPVEDAPEPAPVAEATPVVEAEPEVSPEPEQEPEPEPEQEEPDLVATEPEQPADDAAPEPEPEEPVADEWGIERDAFETVDADQPAEEPAPEDVPEGGAELPDWASVGGDEISLVEETDAAPLPEPSFDTGMPEPEPLLDEALPEPALDEVLPEPEPVLEEVLPEPEPVSDDAPPAPSDQPVQGFTFGKRDPMDKARRLARVLVSDMVMYNAERHQVALSRGTLAEDFEEEIDKSWKEYVDQLGSEIADGEGREFWTRALNDILAKGEEVF